MKFCTQVGSHRGLPHDFMAHCRPHRAAHQVERSRERERSNETVHSLKQKEGRRKKERNSKSMNFTEMAKIRICQRNGKVKADEHEDPV